MMFAPYWFWIGLSILYLMNVCWAIWLSLQVTTLTRKCNASEAENSFLRRTQQRITE